LWDVAAASAFSFSLNNILLICSLSLLLVYSFHYVESYTIYNLLQNILE
jgi:hypothetical protein